MVLETLASLFMTVAITKVATNSTRNMSKLWRKSSWSLSGRHPIAKARKTRTLTTTVVRKAITKLQATVQTKKVSFPTSVQSVTQNSLNQLWRSVSTIFAKVALWKTTNLTLNALSVVKLRMEYLMQQEISSSILSQDQQCLSHKLIQRKLANNQKRILKSIAHRSKICSKAMKSKMTEKVLLHLFTFLN